MRAFTYLLNNSIVVEVLFKYIFRIPIISINKVNSENSHINGAQMFNKMKIWKLWVFPEIEGMDNIASVLLM